MISTVALLPEIDDLVAHFAERTGGVSEGDFASLNLGFSTGDDPDRVRENRRRLGAAVGAPIERWVVPGQTHGARVLEVTPELVGQGALDPAAALRDFDAIVLPRPGAFALALSADCPLVVCVDPIGRRVGVAHAGWRGTVAGVIEALVAGLARVGSEPSTLTVSVSPGIGGCCYPVGEDVFEALAGKPGLAEARSGRRLDLRRIHRRLLEACGIPAHRIAVSTCCSACDSERFFSHRASGGRTGRSGAVVGFRARG